MQVCTAKASRISRETVKSGCAREWGGWGRISDDGPGQNNPDRSEGPWGRAGVEQIFEVGALQRGNGDQPQFMLLRTWDKERLSESNSLAAVSQPKREHIFVRPKAESNLTLIDDLKAEAVVRMREEGFQPAAVVQTSPGNYQAWVKHVGRLDKELGTAVARDLAGRFGGDVKAADWRHFGRLAGFTNTQEKYKRIMAVPGYQDWRNANFRSDFRGLWVDQNGNAYTEERLRAIHAGLSPTARFPFVRLVETSGVIARESERLGRWSALSSHRSARNGPRFRPASSPRGTDRARDP